jgi:hypothetical protein
VGILLLRRRLADINDLRQSTLISRSASIVSFRPVAGATLRVGVIKHSPCPPAPAAAFTCECCRQFHPHFTVRSLSPTNVPARDGQMTRALLSEPKRDVRR